MSDMSKVQKNRWRNLCQLRETMAEGKIKRLAEMLEKDENQVRFLINPTKKGGRFMGENLARQIEQRLGLEDMYLDSLHDEIDEINESPAIHYIANGTNIQKIQAVNWHNLCGFLDSSIKNKELRTMIIDESRLDEPLGKNVFIVEIDDNEFRDAFPPGSQLVVDPDRPPKPGNTVLVRLSDGRCTVVRYRPAGSVLYFEHLETGLPHSAPADPAGFDLVGVVVWISQPGGPPK